MMTPTKLLGASGIAAALIATSAMSTPYAPADYLMSVQIYEGDRLIATPKLTVAADEPAKIEISDAPGNRYAMMITATPQSSGTIAIKSKIDFTASGKRQTASPTLLVDFDTSSTIQFGVESATSKPFRVNFVISKTS